ncbi:MAG: endonuclease/exonuclease/phosphatase family protein [Rhodothermia bacterium]|nr:endonuclease/exonuclease/phosphatase family protein [Rhodothermia bacterium]
MKNLLKFLLLAFLGLTACSGPKTPETSAPLFKPDPIVELKCDGIRVAHLNVEFLFDGVGDEGGADFDWKGDPVKAAEHRKRVGDVLKNLNADVIHLAEVENAEVLEALIQESMPNKGYKVHFVQGEDSFLGQDVAVISRIPITESGRSNDRVKVGDTDRVYGVSKNLYVRFNIGDLPVSLVGLHFLAQPDNIERKPQREAQAEVIRRVAEREAKLGRAVIVTGDFNDFDDVVLDRNGNRPISSVLQTIKAVGRSTTEDDLHNIMADIPQALRFTSLWDKNQDNIATQNELSAIDHMLISRSLYGRLRSIGFIHSYNPLEVTDHFPVTACFAK